jgi:glucoamylase
VPGATEVEQELATRALLDMRLLTRPSGASAAAWYTFWDFCWPRDASWVIAAFAATGHHAEGLSVLKFLQKAQKDDGTWEARYHLIDATPVADGRRWQLDANGWVPWATWFLVHEPSRPVRCRPRGAAGGVAHGPRRRRLRGKLVG